MQISGAVLSFLPFNFPTTVSLDFVKKTQSPAYTILSARPPFYTQTIINSHSARRFPPLAAHVRWNWKKRELGAPVVVCEGEFPRMFFGPSNLAVIMRVQTAGARKREKRASRRGATCCRETRSNQVQHSLTSESNIRSQRPFNCAFLMRPNHPAAEWPEKKDADRETFTRKRCSFRFPFANIWIAYLAIITQTLMWRCMGACICMKGSPLTLADTDLCMCAGGESVSSTAMARNFTN